MCAVWEPALVFILEYEVWRKDLNFKKISPEKLGISTSIFNYGEKHFLVASSACMWTHMWVWAIVCMRTQAYVNVHLCAYVCLEVGSWYQFFPQCLYLIYRSIVFCWSWSLLIPTLLARQLLWKSSLWFPIVWDYKQQPCLLYFHMGSGDLNFDPHSCMASALSTKQGLISLSCFGQLTEFLDDFSYLW